MLDVVCGNAAKRVCEQSVTSLQSEEQPDRCFRIGNISVNAVRDRGKKKKGRTMSPAFLCEPNGATVKGGVAAAGV